MIDDLDIRGRPKKTVVSFQCDLKTWNMFDELVEWEYGLYKKSLVIEDDIKKYVAKKWDLYQADKNKGIVRKEKHKRY
jgi:hypothetical protein